MLLSTTHKAKVKGSVRSWKEKTGRQRIPSEKKTEIAAATPPTTLFDFLYRLRIRSNYKEVDSFLTAVRFPRGGGEFRTQLQIICWHCALVLEFLTVRYLGLRKFERILSGFKRYDVENLVSGLAEARLEVFGQVL